MIEKEDLHYLHYTSSKCRQYVVGKDTLYMYVEEGD